MNILNRPPDGPKREKAPKKPRKSMRKVSRKKAAYRASALYSDARAHMGMVKALPCVICHKPGPSDAHHCISGRYSTQRASDFEVIPLCVQCHRHPHPDAIHSGKKSWEDRNGLDHEYLATVADMLAGEWTP